MKLLPIHFHVDPGPDVCWSTNLNIESTLEDKISLLQNFLDIERMYLKYPEHNGDTDHNYWGSQEYEETVITKDKRKEDKKKDARMAQQMQSVAKHFGSFGKSMGKKLKQIGRGGKHEKLRATNVDNDFVQNTKVNNSYGAVNNQSVILVANLSENQSPNHDEMVENYLKDAKERFNVDKDLKRKNELRTKHSNTSSVCVSPNCTANGTPENNYLCSSCYQAQRREQNIQQRSGSQYVYNTFPGRVRQPSSNTVPHWSTVSPDEIFRCGNSKFYTASNKNVNNTSNFSNSSDLKLSSIPPSSQNNFNTSRVPSPSPDYDNVSANNRFPITRASEANCRTSNCSFFGRAEWSGLCSKCWNDSKPLTVLQNSTKL